MSISSRMRWTILGLCLSLLGCGEDPTVQLVAQLQSADAETRRSAVRALDSYQGLHVTSALAEVIDDSDSQVRQLAIHSLGERGDRAKTHLADIERVLKHPDPNTRITAAFAIRQIEPDNESFVPVLTDALCDGDHHVFLELGAIGPDAQWAVPTLIELLSHRNPRIRALSALTLGQLGPTTGAATTALRQAESDPQINVRKMAQQALELIESP